MDVDLFLVNLQVTLAKVVTGRLLAKFVQTVLEVGDTADYVTPTRRSLAPVLILA